MVEERAVNLSKMTQNDVVFGREYCCDVLSDKTANFYSSMMNNNE